MGSLVKLDIAKSFNALDDREKSYVHYLSRAAWYGARIILHQTSPESSGIFDFIIELHVTCNGDWTSLAAAQGVSDEDLRLFLAYAADFLTNIGNYYASTGAKMVPQTSQSTFKNLAAASERAQEIWTSIEEPMFVQLPNRLGFPGKDTQSAYYPDSEALTPAESQLILSTLIEHSLWPENIRIQKTIVDGQTSFRLLQASEEFDPEPQVLKTTDEGVSITLSRGDLDSQLWMVCRSLNQATRFVAGPLQQRMLYLCQKGIESGDLNLYRESLKLWLHDRTPRVEQVFGFVEPYRDPAGTKAEFEGIVGIADPTESQRLQQLFTQAERFVRQLPWVTEVSPNEPFGPFEKASFEGSGCICMNIVSYSSSQIFAGLNLPNYNDIREALGYKSLIMLNLIPESIVELSRSPFLKAADRESFAKLLPTVYYQYLVSHEVFGHATGRMLRETEPGTFSFDKQNPPTDPCDGTAVTSYYKHGETYTGVFQDIATTVDECRSELVAATLMHDPELQTVFCNNDDDRPLFDDVLYNLYLLLGIDGLEGLRTYDPVTKTWGSAHGRAHFAILAFLLEHSNGALIIDDADDSREMPSVVVDKKKIKRDGRQALSTMLLRLHMYRCTAKVDDCRSFYAGLTKIEGRSERWRNVVNQQTHPTVSFVQPNTILEGKKVSLKEYEPTFEGLIGSWADRQI